MHDQAHLILYFFVVLGVVALPGMDMAYVMASALTGGRRDGLAAVAGLVAGGVCHTVMAVLGTAAVLRLWPALYDVMLLGGAAYLAWIGLQLIYGAGALRLQATVAPRSPAAVFGRAMMTCLLNPKAYIFMLAMFPAFLQAGSGPLWLRAGSLGLITALTQAGVYGAIALAAGGAAHWLQASPVATVRVGRAVGALLIVTAAVAGLRGWQTM
jgi:threonine/homoserine/homoserine lactone efflux protein